MTYFSGNLFIAMELEPCKLVISAKPTTGCGVMHFPRFS